MMDWLHRRGITPSVLELFNVTIHNHPTIGECIRIPFSAEHAKYRRDPLSEQKPKYLYDTGGKVTLYGLDKLKEADKIVVVTEGELDTLVLWSQNIPAVSSTGGAMSFQEEWAERLAPYQVYLCFDNDDAGAEGMVKVLKYIPDAKVILVPETPGVKDVSDYVQRGGDFKKLMESAKSYPTIESIEQDKRDRDGQWLSTRFHDKLLDSKRRVEQRSSSTYTYEGDDKVLKAKSYPMGNLVEFNRYKAKCLWHSDSSPSLHYYPKTNTAYCFGCGKAFDSIDAYMKIHGVGFKDALDKLTEI